VGEMRLGAGLENCKVEAVGCWQGGGLGKGGEMDGSSRNCD
jgi:hypothetical protein